MMHSPEESVDDNNLANLDFRSILADYTDSHNDGNENSEFATPSPYELNDINSLYWNSSDLSEYVLTNQENLKFLIHMNIQSLPAKFDSFQTFLNTVSKQDHKCLPSIVALSETWLSPLNETNFNLLGFQPLISKCRNDNSHRGGVALFVKEGYDFTVQHDLDKFIPKVFESLFITLKPSNF